MREMQGLKQWVTWDQANKDKAPRKLDGGYASSTNSNTWSTFDDAAAAGRGVGFVVTQEDDYIFIDLDHVLNEDRTFKEGREWAEEIVNSFDTYWEVSPSGDGLHGFIKGTLPSDCKNKVYFNNRESILELYHKERYSTITTDLFCGDGVVARCDTTILEKHIIKEVTTPTLMTTVVAGSALSDAEVVERMDTEGQWLVGIGQDGNSELDAALISHISFWSGGDESQVERIARSNPLYRDKWDRKQSGGTFLQYAIKSWNSSGKAEYYTPSTSTVVDLPFSDLSKKEKKKAVKEEVKESKQRSVGKAMDKWLMDHKAHVWFDIETEKYCMKSKGSINYFSKNGFMQFFLSKCNAKLKPAELKIQALHSDYMPNHKEFFHLKGKDYINTFVATPLMSVAPGSDMPVMIGKLFDNLFDDKTQMDQFLNWLAFIYQYRVKTETAWVFAGKQGTGKGVLIDYIIKNIWQHNAVGNLTDSHLESAFNPYMQDKMFVHFNEISADTKKSRIAVKNRIKTWITDDTIFVNSKGIKEVERSNFCNIIMNSNEHIPIDIDVEDRRFNVVRTDNILINASWFVKRDSVEEMVSELEDFASFLAGYKVDKKLAGSVVDSELKSELVQAVKPMPQLIAEAIIERDFDFFLDCDLEGWIHKLDGFQTPKIKDVEDEFMCDFISNKTLSLMVSAAFGRETNTMSASKMIYSKYKVGFKSRSASVRGIERYKKETDIDF